RTRVAAGPGGPIRQGARKEKGGTGGAATRDGTNASDLAWIRPPSGVDRVLGKPRRPSPRPPSLHAERPGRLAHGAARPLNSVNPRDRERDPHTLSRAFRESGASGPA